MMISSIEGKLFSDQTSILRLSYIFEKARNLKYTKQRRA